MENYISTNLQYLINKLNCSQDEFGALFELKRGNVNQYVKSKTQPKIETLQRISVYFNITLDDLVNTDLAAQPRNTNNATKEVAAEPHTPYTNDKDALIAALRETIETQKELIEALRSRNNNAKPQAS